jgi:Protein of unknown function (DUF3443)
MTPRALRWSLFGVVVALAACGGGDGPTTGSTVSSVTSVFAAGGPNVVAMTVSSGPPASTQDVINIPYVSVTVCSSSTSCATIDHVLVDTGSSGLRLLHSALQASGVTLAQQLDPANQLDTLAECLPFAGGYSWGVTASAGIRIGGESANNVPVQIIDDDGSYSPAVPKTCKSYGANENVSALDANGLLGVSVLTQDCGTFCASTANNGRYFSCGASACGPAAAPLQDQVVNPVTLFTTDNNGVILQLPAIADGGAPSATGYLVFGIGTQNNNGLGAATVLATDGNGEFVTSFNGQMLSGSFIDSGSNGLYFADSALPMCQGTATQFYCPATTLDLSATNQSQTGVLLPTSFSVTNLQALSKSNFALDDVAGGLGANLNLVGNYFDFGLPFFYGRTVYVAIEGMSAGGSIGPYYAY